MTAIHKALKKRLSALAVTLAVMLGVFGDAPRAYAYSGGEAPLITEKEVIVKACELLGVKYRLGGKGSPSFSQTYVYPREEFESYGIDCTGLIFWTYCSLGATVRHTDSNNKSLNSFAVPAATYLWHDGTAPYEDLQLCVNGKTASVQITRNKLGSGDLYYYRTDEGGFISPGSVVIMQAEDYMDDHGWIYIGYAPGGKEGIRALLESKYGVTGISDEDIVYEPSEGDHWRIESTVRPRYLGEKITLYDRMGTKITVATPIYKTGVVISNRRTAASGVCTGQVVFRLAGLPADKDEPSEDKDRK